MALTKPARSKILALVQDAKRLLMKEVEEQLQQFYGVRPDGTVLMIEQLTTSDCDFIYTARVLRQRLDYIKTNLPDKKNEDVEAVRQLVREQAFTILNRFASLRMAEERGIIKETVRKEYNSEGFQVFDSITGQGQTASQYIRYKWYIHAIFDELALDLPSVFDRYSPYALIFPSEQVMNRLLDIINREEITLHREEGFQPVNLWKEDETIGWIYQYYNSREEISAMRDASSAPRNSQELAVRNQFFTPRYVVQFLTDNSLGRIWYEMTKGNTGLSETCQYLIRRNKELFLDKGNTRPENADEETDYIEHRPIKDPREILMLDPACGSMHFGLYCFDLFEHIYTEAWDNYPELMTDMRNTMTRSDFVKQIPELIIRHNIHGVDIDPRALQIAGLSLWLRAQKSFDKQNLPANQRSQITRSNLVLAEPMPGSIETLSQLVQPLDAPMRKLVLSIWDKMKLAGETGLLLRIEDEIDKTINEIVNELAEGKMSTQLSIGSDAIELQAAEKAAIYATKQYRERFLNSAETEVLKMLKQLAETATDGDAYQKLLFADDTARGFAFIELVRKKYDVVVMNPPFGAASEGSSKYIDINYPTSKNDLAATFVERMIELLQPKSMVGSITTRTIFFLGSYTNWRTKYLIDENTVKYFADLGGGVLDAMVETAAYLIQKGINNDNSIFLRSTKEDDKAKKILSIIRNPSNRDLFTIDPASFKLISNTPICYWLDSKTLQLFKNSPKFLNKERAVRQGLGLSDSFRYCRMFWEVNNENLGFSKSDTLKNKYWVRYINTISAIPFYYDSYNCLYWNNDGYEIKKSVEAEYGSYTKRVCGEANYFETGLSWAYRTAKFQPHIIPRGEIFSTARFITTFENEDDLFSTVSFWNSEYVDYCLKLSMEKDLQPKFISGTVNKLPHPSISSDLRFRLIEISKVQYKRVKRIFIFDEKSIAFSSNSFIHVKSIDEYVRNLLVEINDIKIDYKSQMKELNQLIYDHFKITNEEQKNIADIVAIAGKDDGIIFNIDKSAILNNLFNILLGSAFKRWDVRILKKWKREWSDEDMFKVRKHSPFMFGQKESTLDLILPEYHKEIEQIWKEPYPLEPLKENAASNAVVSKLKEVIMYFWPESASTIEFELQDHFGVSDLETIFTNPNKFFDRHLKDYSRNKRVSPIYWPISTASGSYTIWLYYPKMNEQTLFKVVNDFILPKQQEVAEEIKKLENNPNLDNKGKKELQDSQNLFHELKDMEKDLLEVAALPYKPNHDDGVLITAAPLYKFFRHSKWKKSTEECWKALQKGEYDWAHLAYSIWPERVTKKCKKDLSMAIAHGLEEICELKPKEKKEKKVAKSTNKNIQGKLID
jgi:hypothetical protein